MTYEDEVQIRQLIEDNVFASRDTGEASDRRHRQLHVLVLLEKGIVGAYSGGDGLNVEEEGSVEPREG